MVELIALAIVVVPAFVLGYAAGLMRPEPKYLPAHSAEVVRIQPSKDSRTALTVPFVVGTAGRAA